MARSARVHAAAAAAADAKASATVNGFLLFFFKYFCILIQTSSIFVCVIFRTLSSICFRSSLIALRSLLSQVLNDLPIFFWTGISIRTPHHNLSYQHGFLVDGTYYWRWMRNQNQRYREVAEVYRAGRHHQIPNSIGRHHLGYHYPTDYPQ